MERVPLAVAIYVPTHARDSNTITTITPEQDRNYARGGGIELSCIRKIDRMKFNHQLKNVASELEEGNEDFRDKAETQVVEYVRVERARTVDVVKVSQ